MTKAELLEYAKEHNLTGCSENDTRKDIYEICR